MAELGCVSDQDLKAFVLGELPERLAAAVARHLELCPVCDERARRWDDLADGAIQALRGAAPPPTLAHDRPADPGTDSSTAGSPEPPSPPGFTLLAELGRGAVGVVYQARQHQPERVVALKCLRDGPDPGVEQRARFLAEADAIARLHHPHIVQVHAVGEHRGQPFLCLEYLDGGTLAKKINGQPQPPRAAARLLAVLAGAVQHAHEQGVIHRDLKPSNVLLTGDGTPKISDFGLARFGRPELTATGAIMGTPSYMAPEQARGDNAAVGPAADIWALGAILYELLTGRPPFRGLGALDTLKQVVEDEPVPPARLQPGVPRDLEVICLKCLEKSPVKRYPSAEALADDLRRFQAGEPIRARPVGAWERVLKWAKRKPAAAALAVVSVATVLSLGATGASLFWGGRLAEQRDRAEALRVQAEAASEKAKLAEAEAEKARIGEAQQRALVDRLRYFADADRAQRYGEAGEYGRMRELLDSLGQGRPGQPDLPGFEYHYLQRQCRLRRFLRGHTAGVSGVSWSPDGRRLASASGDGAVKVWDARAGKEILTIKGAGGGVSWSPDGRRLASAPGGKDILSPGEVRIWDAESGKETLSLQGHTSSVGCLSWSPDGKRLASASSGNNFQPDIMIKVWDTESGKEVLTLGGHWGPVMCLSWSPDGKRLASGAGTFPPWDPAGFPKKPNDDTIKVWDTKSGQEVLTLKGHTHFVQGVSWRPDGQRLASASWDKTVRVWDARTGKESLTLRGHRSHVHGVSWSPDGQRLASASDDQTMRVWDARTGQEVLLLKGHTGGVRAVVWSPDGGRLASASTDRTVGLWDTQTGQEARAFRGHTNWVYGVSWSPDGRRLASGSADGTIQVWDAHTGQAKRKLQGSGGVSFQAGPSWSPDGKRLAGSGVGTLKVWDAESGQEVVQLKGHTSIAWSPDGRRLATSGFPVQVWDVASGKEVLLLKGRAGGGRGMAWSPDGRRLASGSGDGTVLVWDVESGKEVLCLQANAGDVFGVCWSPDGRRLASACRDGTIRLWDAETGKESPFSLRGHTAPVTSVAWSPDGRRLASASNDWTVRVWEAQTGQEALVLRGHTDVVQCVTWSPDGRCLASASMDGTVRVWEAAE
jgi:WD40 repeat protein